MSIATSIQSKANVARDALNDKADTLAERGSALAHEADAKAHQVTEAAAREINALVEALNAKLKSLGLDAANLSETARDTVGSLEKSISKEIVERPVRSLAIAGLIGLAIGVFSRK